MHADCHLVSMYVGLCSFCVLSSQLYEFFVPEDTSREITIGQVEGSDRDIGPNAVLYYHLLGSSKWALWL